MAEATQAAPAPAGAAAPTIEMVKLVNTGRAPIQILPTKNGTLAPNSQGSLIVPKALADKLRRAYPFLKDVNDIFPDAVNVDALKRENADLKRQHAAVQGLLANADAAKAADAKDAQEANAAAEKRAADAEAKAADLAERLQAFIAADPKKAKDVAALQEEHAAALQAVPAGA